MATSPIYSWPEPDNTDLVKNGALAIRTLGNAIDTTMATMTPKSTFTAKGSIAAATAASTPANLAVGNNGEVLVADSSTSTGLRYQSAYNGNAIINGGMDIWQRGVTFTNPTVSNYTADRYMINRTGDVTGATVSRSTSTATGFQYAMQWQRTAGNTGTANMNMYYGLESSDSYRFAGQTATLSFYAKAGANYSGGVLSAILLSGTATDAKPYAGTTTVVSETKTLTASYQRFSITGTFGSSITQAFFNLVWTPTGTAGADDSVYVTGIQLELGSVPTSFKRAGGGSIQQELAACQRYYQRVTAAASGRRWASGFNASTTSAAILLVFPVIMRTPPTALEQSGTAADYTIAYESATATLTSVPAFSSATDSAMTITCGTSGLTAGQGVAIRTANASAYLGWSAEL